MILEGDLRSYHAQGFGRVAIEGKAAQELGHVAHVHLRELLHVLSQVMALHLHWGANFPFCDVWSP